MRDRNRRLYVLLLTISLAAGLVMTAVYARSARALSLFHLTNLVGPTTESLLQGRGLIACTEAMGTPGNPICFHSARMPMASVVVALGVRLLGDHFLPVNLLKTFLLLLPLQWAMWLVVARLPADPRRRWVAIALLLAPFVMTAFMADVVNMQVEEGYSYAFLALAAALVWFRGAGWVRRDHWGEGLLMGLALVGLYLSKSSMVVAAMVLAVAFALRTRSGAARALALGLLMVSGVGWAMWQHHASGRYTLGTSLDGMNLHKGENEAFLNEYPPQFGNTLDIYDWKLNTSHYFPDEWSFDDFHEDAAVEFMKSHPGESLRGDLRKLNVMFVAMVKYGSGSSHRLAQVAELGGLLLFRLILWVALGFSVVAAWRRWERLRGDGVVFLLLVGAVALPYTLGFAYTRHVSVLIYPSVLLCCRMLAGTEPAKGLH